MLHREITYGNTENPTQTPFFAGEEKLFMIGARVRTVQYLFFPDVDKEKNFLFPLYLRAVLCLCFLARAVPGIIIFKCTIGKMRRRTI